MKAQIHLLFLIVLTSTITFAQTVVEFGTGEIEGSTTGLSDASGHISGDSLGLGVSFDLTITASNFSNPTEPVTAQDNGLGVSGGVGSYAGLDNRNNLDPTDDEALTFSISNVQGVAANQSIRITGIGVIFGNTAGQAEQYELPPGLSGTISSSPEILPVNQESSVTITARGNSTGAATDTRYSIDKLYVQLVQVPRIELDVEVTQSGQLTLKFPTTAGQDYEIQQAASETNNSWATIGTVTGTGSSYTFNRSVDLVTQPEYFFRVCEVDSPTGGNGDLQNGAVLTVDQTWSQEPGGFERTADVRVPSGSGPFPVVIMFHGNGGNSNFINSMGGRLDNLIRVAPNGYLTSWNVDNENSKAPDVAFVNHLITMIKSYDNVDPNQISLYGSSNGSGMINRLLIELSAGSFDKAAGRVSQMISKMYQGGQFRYNSSDNNNYDEIITPASGRKIINVCGTSDGAVPYLGGNGVGTNFMNAQESLYRFAQAMGETGLQLDDTDGVPGDGVTLPADIVRYSYLNGDVVHYKVIGGDHALNPYSNQVSDLIADFILNQ